MTSYGLAEKESVPTAPARRLKQLDLLRAFAILLVIGHHSGINPNFAGPFSFIVKRLEDVGWIGVDCFFVLSGFLIGGLIFAEVRKTGSFECRRFLVRRAFKIWPQYYSYLIFFFLLGITCFNYSAAARFKMMEFAVVSFQNYSRRWESHIWSLAVEEHFYLILALTLVMVLTFCGKKCKAGIPHFLTGGIIVIAAVTVERLLLGRFAFNQQLHYFGTHARLDSLVLGVLIAYVSTFHQVMWTEWLRRPTIFCILAGLLLAPIIAFTPHKESWFAHTFGYSFLYTGFGCLVISAMGASQRPSIDRWLGGRIAGWLAWIGVNSYGIYLWHQDVIINPLQKWVYPILTSWPGSLAFAVEAVLVVGGSLLVGALSTACIERPMLTLRDRVWPSRARAVLSQQLQPTAV